MINDAPCPKQSEPPFDRRETEQEDRLFRLSWYLFWNHLFARVQTIWSLLTSGTAGQVLTAAGDGNVAAFVSPPTPSTTTITAQGGANTTLTTTLADVTGATMILPVGTWVIAAAVRLLYSVSSGGVTVVLNVGGADYELDPGVGSPNPVIDSSLTTGTGTDTWNGTEFQHWRVQLGSTTTVKLRANKAINAGSAFAGGKNTMMIATQVG